MPDCAIFADTGWEEQGTYQTLLRLEQHLPFPVYRVSAGDIVADHISAKTRTTMPFYSKGGQGKSLRKCTTEYKIVPVERKIRELLGLSKGQRWPKEQAVEQWFGISLDEIQRMKVSQRKAVEFRYPLVEMRMTRGDCTLWCERNGYPIPPRSACIGCPYHNNDEWRRIRNNPDEWASAIKFDAAIRLSPGMTSKTYLHRDCMPLEEVDLSTPADHGQLSFLDECDGVCGV